MSESWVEVSEGSGKKLHSNTRSIGGNTVHDEIVVRGEPYLASYIANGKAIGGATATRLFTLNAGASLNLRIRAINIQPRSSGTAQILQIDVHRITTAAAAGTAVTPAPLDPSDSASGASARMYDGITLITGATPGVTLMSLGIPLAAAAPQASYTWRWEPMHGKPIIVAAGTANGIALTLGSGVSGSTFNAWIEFDECNF